MPAGRRLLAESGALPASVEARFDPEIFFVDLVRSKALLDAEEKRTPRLSSADHDRARSMASDPERCWLWRTARIATRIVIERAGGVGLRKMDFAIEAGGRPALASGGPYFNISHSGEAAIIALSKHMPVGVDLERKRSLTMSDDRRQRIVAAALRIAPEATLSSEDDDDVLVAWVRIEAAAKALGTGIGRMLTEQGVIGQKSEDRSQMSAHNLAVKDLAVAEGYVAAIAAERLAENIAVLRFPFDSLDELDTGTSS